VCGACGYERDLSVRTVSEALALQDHFEGSARSPSGSEAAWPKRASLVATAIRNLCPSGGRILDVGCNTGLNLFALGPGWEKYGIEPSRALAEVARAFSGATIFQTSVEDFHWQGPKFDVVMSLAVIEHVFDPRSFVEKLLDLLRPGGILVLMTGDKDSYTARKMGSRWPLYVSPDHISFFSAKSVRQLLSRCECRVVKEEWRFMYFHWGLGPVTLRFLMKLMEVAGFVKWPWHDLYYVYCRKA